MPRPKPPVWSWGSMMRPKPLTQLAASQANSGPNYASSSSALAGGSGSWTNPGNAAGGDDNTYAVWTIP